jgi:uncharacterized protein (DUF433 family)
LNATECTELTEVVWVDPDRMGGVACFRGTRVPIETLFSWLASGSDLEEILEQFPSVSKEQATMLLEWSMRKACEKAGALDYFTR